MKFDVRGELEMEWYQMAVFIYTAALIHFLADLSAFLKRRGKLFFILHCILYAVPFVPLFWWMDVNFSWLIFISGSHILIDSQGNQIHKLVEKIFKDAKDKSLSRPTVLGLDQVLHLLALLAIAILIF